GWTGIGVLERVPSHVQFALLVAGVALVAVGLGGLASPPGPLSMSWRGGVGAWSSPLSKYWRGDLGVRLTGIKSFSTEWLFLALLTLIAFGLRAWELNDTLHLFIDEVNFASAIRLFWHDTNIPILEPISGNIAFPKVYPYWQTFTVALMGRDLAALRIVSAVIGALTVPALYALARVLFDRPTAWIAAALLVVFPPHLHFSRIGINNIADPLFGTLAFACLGRAMQSRHRRDYALAGVLLGLTQYFYEGGRLLYPGVVLLWIGFTGLIWRRRLPDQGLITLVLAAGIVAAPVYYTLWARDLPTTARVDNVGLTDAEVKNLITLDADAWDRQRWHVEEMFLFYVQLPEASLFYGGDTPLLLVYMVPPFLAGVAVVLARRRAPGPLLLILWGTLVPLGNALMSGPPGAARFVVVLPAVVLLIAVGLRHMTAILLDGLKLPRLRLSLGAGAGGAAVYVRLAVYPERVRIRGGLAWGRRRSRLGIGGRVWLAHLVVIVVLLSAVGQVAYYFGPHVDWANYHLRYAKGYRDGEDAMFRSVDFPPGTWVHLVSEDRFPQNYAQYMIKYLADDVTVYSRQPWEITAGYLSSFPRSVDHAFFLEPDDAETLRLIYEEFPLVSEPQLSPYDVPLEKQFVLYYAPRSRYTAD
ncbi:MAG: glycosyltransferase family 39 protein, partial [Anaerolineae bacterium]|nr:glycosyltransferase family 39 protein [Anaerolineae bacterium]